MTVPVMNPTPIDPTPMNPKSGPARTDLVPLEPRVGRRLGSVIADAELLYRLVGALGSPLNVVLPEQIADNVGRFREVYHDTSLSGTIFFAHKASRSSALVRELAVTEAGMDIASLGELQHVTGAGFTPGRIMATGPKSREFRWLACRAGVTVNVDSLLELRSVAAFVEDYDLPPVQVMLRLSGFEATGVKVLSRVSRFGTDVRELDDMLDVVTQHKSALSLVGVGYHLDTISLAEKAAALEGCIKVLDECRRRGLDPRSVDLGGGYGISYLAHAEQWQAYTTALADAVLGRRPPLTWQGHGYGYGVRAERGTLSGSLGLYPAYRPSAAERNLADLLDMTAPSLGRPLATLLLENLYDLDIEPGRALTDQCGMTLARVSDIRHTPQGDCMVQLDMNSRDLCVEENAVHFDPILLPARERTGGLVGVYLIGNLCLESDFITRRQVVLPQLPEPGDLLAFPNTAGYLMDFSADHALQQPIARKVAVYKDTGGSLNWSLDEEYWPIMKGRP